MLKPYHEYPYPRMFEHDPEQERLALDELYRFAVLLQRGVPKASMPDLDPAAAKMSQEVVAQLIVAIIGLSKMELCLQDLYPPPRRTATADERGKYHNFIRRKLYYLENHDAITTLIVEGLTPLIKTLDTLPPVGDEGSTFSVPLVYLLPNPRQAIHDIHKELDQYRYQGFGLFNEVGQRLHDNVLVASGHRAGSFPHHTELVTALDSKLPLDKLVDAYLAGTPFHDLFMARLPLAMTYEDRFSHWHVLGGVGSGKTTLLETQILSDILDLEQPSVVVVDPHSDMLRRLTHTRLGIDDRILIIDPRDTQFPVALNIFATNRERMAGYDEAMREQVTAGVIETFDYLFSGLFNLQLTGKQQTFFRYVTRLMLTLPEAMGRNATILDMLKLMLDPAPYQKAIAILPDMQREFFERDFLSKTYTETREQVRYRLQSLIENPTLARLFTSEETKVDFFTELNRGTVIYVDCAKDFLKGGSPIFGRLIISLIFQAVMERAVIAESERRPTFIYIDEAWSFFDSNVDLFLTEARKYKAGLVLSHQTLEQATSSLRAALAANTNIKMTGGLSAADARAMAPDMRTTAEGLLNQPKFTFATYIKKVTPHAVPVGVKPIPQLPQFSPEAYAQLIDRNRARVSVQASTPSHDPTPPQDPPQPPTQRLSSLTDDTDAE